MIYVTTALFAEAKPIIEHFRLAKTESPAGKYQMFANDEMTLIVSGTGALSAAAATATMLAAGLPKSRDLFANVGLCGAVRPELELGEAVLCRKIVHRCTGRAYYPDMLIPHTLREAVLETRADVAKAERTADGGEPGSSATGEDESGGNKFGASRTGAIETDADRAVGNETFIGDVVDMEGAGCYEAASAYLSPHQLLFVKIVSDHLDAARLTPGDVSGLIRQNLPVIERLFEQCLGMLAFRQDALDEEDERLLELVCARLRLSATMRHELYRMARTYKMNTGRNLSFLLELSEPPPASKQEGKIRFAQIRERLVHP